MTTTRLDGFFQETSPDAVRAALSSLLDEAASPGDRSHGEVRSGTSTYHAGGCRYVVRAGLACEAIFGPSASGERRFGHIALAGPVLHPALIAEPFDDARRVRLVPVLPLTDRPESLVDAPTAVTPQPHPVTDAYAALLAASARLDRMHALAAPEVLLIEAEGALQAAFDRLLRTVAGRELPVDGWLNDNPPRALHLAPVEDLADAPGPVALLFLDEERVLVQRPGERVVVRLDDGAVLSRHAATAPPVRSTDASGTRVVFADDGVFASPDESDPDADLVHGVAVLDLATGTWLRRYPDDLRAAFTLRGEPEDLTLLDSRRDRVATFDTGTDRPRLVALSRDHAFAWLGEGDVGVIVDTDTALVHVDVGSLPPPDADVPVLGDGEPDPDVEPACAIAVTPAHCWHLLDGDGNLRVEGRVVARLACARLAAAFSPRADRLLVAEGPDALMLVALDPEPRVERHLPIV